MPEKYEKLLLNIAMVIFILVIPWFFNMLASKVTKRDGDQSDTLRKPGEEEGLPGIFFEDETTRQSIGSEDMRAAVSAPPIGSDTRIRESDLVGPQVTSKPIKPKWWGA